MKPETTLIITTHAFQRSKERMNWPKKVLEKMAEKAFEKGIKHSDTKGRLNKYIAGLSFKYKQGNNIRIYGQDVFLFHSNTLITVFRVPNNLLKNVKSTR